MIKLMTFNIRNGDAADGGDAWLFRHDLVAQVIEQEDPDVFGLQEAFDYQLDYLLERLPGYLSAGVGRDDGERAGEFSPILYRREFVAEKEGTFWLSETPAVPGSHDWGSACTRICTWVELATTGGHWSVFNCHLDHVSAEARKKGLELIVKAMPREGASVLMGDFNCGEEELAGYGVLPSWLADTFRRVEPAADEVNTYHGFDASRVAGPKIDYIFAGPASRVRVMRAGIVRTTFDGRSPSDHFPVVAMVEVLPG